MHFTETRGNDGSREPRVSFSAALMSPIASFGGIYSPEELPSIDRSFIESHLQSTYAELALDLLRLMQIDIADETLIGALELYGEFDDPKNP
ncbi:MAG: threonine synthase, partial [Planctomycetota bacterium]